MGTSGPIGHFSRFEESFEDYGLHDWGLSG